MLPTPTYTPPSIKIGELIPYHYLFIHIIEIPMKLIQFAKNQGATKMSKVVGEKGAFISCTKADGTTFTLPVGKRSQTGKLSEYNVLIAANGQAIATVNSYVTEEEITL